ncbi:hypothetical protein [Caballeronia sordidicola]|uniref:hypothetical protein n=1 Tax=Caballeronia sordidicola TaxID=196367 RepID=UPI000B21FAB1|nr:hypothetical protein [Caballeronia sordidicola]
MQGTNERDAEDRRELFKRVRDVEIEQAKQGQRIGAIEEQLPDFVKVVQFKLVQTIVYITCGTILMAVLGAWIAKVVTKS